MKLSILIPTLTDRIESFNKLYHSLNTQANDEVEILTLSDSGEATIGTKRNLLLEAAKGDYVCFVDDDDFVSSDYVETLLKAIESEPDCVSLRGVITWKGENPEIFEHSITYHAYHTNENRVASVKYERYPNHLNCIKASIAKQFTFPEWNHGEDTDWATQIYNSGKLLTEVRIDKVLYHYLYRTKKLELL